MLFWFPISSEALWEIMLLSVPHNLAGSPHFRWLSLASMPHLHPSECKYAVEGTSHHENQLQGRPQEIANHIINKTCTPARPASAKRLPKSNSEATLGTMVSVYASKEPSQYHTKAQDMSKSTFRSHLGHFIKSFEGTDAYDSLSDSTMPSDHSHGVCWFWHSRSWELKLRYLKLR